MSPGFSPTNVFPITISPPLPSFTSTPAPHNHHTGICDRELFLSLLSFNSENNVALREICVYFPEFYGIFNFK